jgi:hypothetical protein
VTDSTSTADGTLGLASALRLTVLRARLPRLLLRWQWLMASAGRRLLPGLLALLGLDGASGVRRRCRCGPSRTRRRASPSLADRGDQVALAHLGRAADAELGGHGLQLGKALAAQATACADSAFGGFGHEGSFSPRRSRRISRLRGRRPALLAWV